MKSKVLVNPFGFTKTCFVLVDKQPKETWLLPHARDNQLQVGSSGDPIQPLVAEILLTS
jgi:hypothetical protein